MLTQDRVATACRPFLVLLVCAGAGPLARADEAQASGALQLEDITVTAQRREQRLQDVGTSVTVLGGDAIGGGGPTNVTDLAGLVPGMQFNQFSPTSTVFNLRGVSQNDFGDHQEAPVAVYSDEVYIGSMGAIAGSMFDLERVEVLRGPQGTLFGRNATGGLVQYVSRKPTEAPEAGVSLSYGRFNHIQSEGYVSGPLSDRFRARLAFSTSNHDGYINNRIGKDAGSRNQYAGRLMLEAVPNDRVDALVKLYVTRNDNETSTNYSHRAAAPNAQGLGELLGPNEDFWGTCAACDVLGYRNPGSVLDQAYDYIARFSRTVYGATGRVTVDFNGFTLTSVTDYQRMKKRYGEDSDASSNDLFVYEVDQHYRQYSQELRLNGDVDNLRWTTGAYLLDIKADVNSLVALAPLGLFSRMGLLVDTKTWAGFGQVEYDLSPQWTVIGGVRYTHDDKTNHYELTVDGDPSATVSYDPALNPDADRKFNSLSYKLELDYKPNSDLLLFASVNRGVKGGGWVAPQVPPVDPNTFAFDQEKLTNYEVGFKSTLLGGAARLNGSVFYYDYNGYQAFFIQNFLQVIGNRDATVKGGELEFAIVPTEGLNLELGLSHLDTEVRGVSLPNGDVVDREMPQAPKWSVNALARYEWSAAGGKFAVQTDGKWNTRTYFSGFNSPVDREAAYATLNASASYTTNDEAWTLTAFCRNLTDKRHRIYSLDLAGAIGLDQSVYAPPRWWGVGVTYKWAP